MPENNCSCHHKCKTENEIAIDFHLACPICKEEGQLVPIDVVRVLLKSDYSRKTSETDYYICTNPECNNVYFDKDFKQNYSTDTLRKPVWFKKGSNPKIACYCNNITFEEIKIAVQKHKLFTYEKIIDFYRDNPINKCSLFNPTGECCQKNVEKLIEEYQKKTSR